MSSYKVVPFIGRISTGYFSTGNAGTVAKQLAAEIEQHTTNGWVFHSLAKADIEVKPGCIAGLLGAKISYITFDQLIFVHEQIRTTGGSGASESGEPVGSPHDSLTVRHVQGPAETASSRVAHLMGRLAAADARVREEAIVELGDMGAAALPALSAIVVLKQDADRSVRQRAGWATEKLTPFQKR